jgi:hypothetical protein
MQNAGYGLPRTRLLKLSKNLNRHRTEAQQGGKTERKEPFSPLRDIESAAETSLQGCPELGRKIRQAETANLSIKLLRLLHIAQVSGVCDDC